MKKTFVIVVSFLLLGSSTAFAEIKALKGMKNRSKAFVSVGFNINDNYGIEGDVGNCVKHKIISTFSDETIKSIATCMNELEEGASVLAAAICSDVYTNKQHIKIALEKCM